MNATQTASHAALLDRAALHVRRAQVSAKLACAIAISRPETAREQATRAGEEATKALTVLCDRLGAALPSIEDAESDAEPELMQTATTGDALDLRALAALDGLDTSETRALMSALDALLPLAEAVDKQRGHTLPKSIPTAPGETRGTDFAESVGELVLRLRGEIFGGNGRD